MKKIAILGSTGSIGTQALDIVRKNPDQFCVTALTCGKQVDLFAEQLREFKPALAYASSAADAKMLQTEFPKIQFYMEEKGLQTLATDAECDLLLSSLVGMKGLAPTYSAIRSGKDVALANKETLVAGGALIMQAIRDAGVSILPVDSEHSAIFQALEGNRGERIKRVLLTASGGPFRGYTLEQLEHVTLAQTLKHPNWSMGAKVTVDSATMMNKGLEVMEAKWLFDLEPDQIEVLVHKESIVHSMVEYEDHSILAQLGAPDMRCPIAYAFSYPNRLKNDLPAVDFIKLGALHFEEADQSVFRCLGMAYEALRAGESYSVVLNAANEVLVQRFLEGRIAFLDIQRGIERILQTHKPMRLPEMESILELDRETRAALNAS